MRAAWQAGLVLLIVVAAGLLSLRSGGAPAPLPADAPPGVFSAGRAMAVLERVLDDERPHPVGSAANAAVRDRILAEFDRIGIAARVRTRFVCGAHACTTVDNVLGHLPGAVRGDAILLTAHYDSVAAGPGAGDDGSGVATVLEAARALKAGEPLGRDVWFLLTDGEEAGLLGAYAFVKEPEFADIGWVVNVEARGDVGASWLIETQPGNAGVVAAIGRALPRPAGTSLDYEIYKTLPNDTDFTVYRMQCRGGANFALARGAARYHTPRDDIAHLSAGSVQHHGDNAVSLVRAFADTPAERLRADHDAVFVHPFSAFQLAWPVAWNAWLLAAGLLGWAALAWRARRRGALRVAGLLAASGMLTLGWLAVLVPAWLVAWALESLGATPAAWTAQGTALAACFALLGAGLVACLARPVQRRWGDTALALGALVPFALLAMAAVVWMPGASFGGLLPLLALMLVGHLVVSRTLWWAGASAFVAAVVWVPYVATTYDAIGRDGLVPTALLAGLAVLPLLPVLAGLGRGARLAAIAQLAAALAFGVAAWLRPAFDDATPRPMNLLLAAEAGQPSRLLASPLAEAPKDILDANGFGREAKAVLPFSGRRYFVGPEGPVLPAPEFEVVADEVEGGTRRLRLRLIPAQAGDELTLHLPHSVDKASVRVNGEPLSASRWPWWHGMTSIATPASGVTVEFEASASEALQGYLVGETG
ncbi:MAG TPA: M20/M25/M40 family metallo-hydrolase, partial [Luteimonas sp.]|nr:M20/M25/M40 family metallo-hydrolase [Luteimonas sp.]